MIQSRPWTRPDSGGTALARLPSLARTHWLFTLVMLVGTAGRVLTMVAYQPALLYIDSSGYLNNRVNLNPTGSQPIGYSLILRLLLYVGDLGMIAGIQHLLGLAMGLCIYALLLRKGAPRWLATLAAAPILLDAYEWQIEEYILSDSLFLALITFALTILAWHKRPTRRAIISAGLILGCACIVRTVGEIVIVPAVIYLLIVCGPRWRKRAAAAAIAVAAFAIPLAADATYTAIYNSGTPSVTQSSGDLLYGRVATFADCAEVPSDLKSVCPAGSVAYRTALGPDYYAHDPSSPEATANPAKLNQFTDYVLEHQPLAFAKAVGSDFLQLFTSPRGTTTGGTAISRWQFQTYYELWQVSPASTNALLAAAGDSGGYHVNVGVAQVLRDYQLNGGYTPGWYFSAALLAGLGGVLGLTRKARKSGMRAQALLWTGTGVSLLLGADIFEFSWRYQLPALVLLPMGGAFGIMAMFGFNPKQATRPLLSPYPDTVDAAAEANFYERYSEAQGAAKDVKLAPVVVVIAAYNEAEGLGAVLDKLPTNCHGMEVMPLVIVDGATDATADVAYASGAHTCVAPKNRGQGAALRLGYHLAKQCGAEYVVTTDADGQYDTATLPDLLAPILDGKADFVTGSRILGSSESKDRIRQAGCHIFAALVSILMRKRVTDTSFGLRAMRAELPTELTLEQPQYQSSELLICIIARGYRVTEIPATIAAREAGKTKKGNNLLYGTRYARVVLGTWWRERREAKTTVSKSTNFVTNTTP